MRQELNERNLVRMIQKGDAVVDVRTGKVTSVDNEIGTSGGDYLGTLRRKAIPDRRKLEREFKAVETLVRDGREVEMTPEKRIPELEQRYHIFPGKVHRLILAGSNPLDTLTLDGVLTRIRIYAEQDGFTLREIELRNGLEYDSYSEKKPFDLEIIRLRDGRFIGFGRVIDEEGFYRVRERIKKK